MSALAVRLENTHQNHYVGNPITVKYYDYCCFKKNLSISFIDYYSSFITLLFINVKSYYKLYDIIIVSLFFCA